jgi:hypothetical protein
MSSGGTTGSASDPATPPLFREVQRFRQWFFWVPVSLVTAIMWWQFAEQVVLGHSRRSDLSPSWVAWALFIAFGLGFPAFALVVRLVTEVRPGMLSVRLIPFRAKRILFQEILGAEARRYSPLREFGGWGIRIGRDGRAYTAYGNQAVQLTLAGGGRVLIGTQHSDELLAALRLAGMIAQPPRS